MVTLNLYISVGFLNEIVKQENCTLNIIIDIRETKKQRCKLKILIFLLVELFE